MGFIREPIGVDFVITPSPAVVEDVAFISTRIQQHKMREGAERGHNLRHRVPSVASFASVKKAS